MASNDLVKVFDLLTRSNRQGIRIMLSQERLLLKFSKGLTIDQDLLNEIKSHEAKLIAYLLSCSVESGDPALANVSLNSIVHNGKRFHKITPVQLYWVHEDKEKEVKKVNKNFGVSLNTWYVCGEFNPEIFRRTIAFLIRRHESLRSSFCNINEEYLMAIADEDSPLYDLEYFDLSASGKSEAEIEDITTFRGHRFSLSEGPLFLTRLIRTGHNAYIISIKIHHVITDTWSFDILLRDILVAYRDIMEKGEPQLPALKYQLKEYLAFTNSEISKNFDRDYQYWHSTCKYLPDELIIPGARRKQRTFEEKICKMETFEIPAEVADGLGALSKKFSVSIFVILQAAFKSFFYRETAQTDIIIGTYIFGRDYPGTEDQIGCYAKTMLIRTSFEATDSFGDIVLKVKRSNDDMQKYKAYTLMDACAAMLSDHQHIHGTFWKVNLLYNDIATSYVAQSNSANDLSEKLNGRVIRRYYKGTSRISIDMDLDFTRSDGNLRLNVRYDSSIYDASVIRKLITGYLAYTHTLVSEQ